MPNCNFYAIDNDFEDILNFIFEELNCKVFQSYSEHDSDLIEFKTSLEVINYYNLDGFSTEKGKSADLMLWPVEASPNFKVAIVNLNPKKCKDATYRYRSDGWGLIHLELKGINRLGLQYSHTNHNTEKRAKAWEPNYIDELGPVSEWDWKVVASTSRKLNNFIKKQSNKKVGPMPVMPNAESINLAGAVAV